MLFFIWYFVFSYWIRILLNFVGLLKPEKKETKVRKRKHLARHAAAQTALILLRWADGQCVSTAVSSRRTPRHFSENVFHRVVRVVAGPRSANNDTKIVVYTISPWTIPFSGCWQPRGRTRRCVDRPFGKLLFKSFVFIRFMGPGCGSEGVGVDKKLRKKRNRHALSFGPRIHSYILMNYGINTHGIVFTLKTPPLFRGPSEYVYDKTVSFYLRYVQTFRKII